MQFQIFILFSVKYCNLNRFEQCHLSIIKVFSFVHYTNYLFILHYKLNFLNIVNVGLNNCKQLVNHSNLITLPMQKIFWNFKMFRHFDTDK